jgi:hypothetical protein
MTKVFAEDVKVGMGFKTWFGTHTVIKIHPYNGIFDFALNILEFSNGSKMTNCKSDMYDLVYEMGEK